MDLSEVSRLIDRRWDDELVARLVADDGLELRRRLIPAIIALRSGRPLPKAWQL